MLPLGMIVSSNKQIQFKTRVQKPYPKSSKSISPISDQNGWKSYTVWAAHGYMANVKEYLPPSWLGERYFTWSKRFVKPHSYGLGSLGYPRQPFPWVALAEVIYSLFLCKIQPTVYVRIADLSRGTRQLGWASCLTSAGRVALVSGTTFLQINTLAHLTGTTLGETRVA